jgi:hypothetical protein
MPADLTHLHKYMLDVEHIGIISDEMRAVVEELRVAGFEPNLPILGPAAE